MSFGKRGGVLGFVIFGFGSQVLVFGFGVRDLGFGVCSLPGEGAILGSER